MRSIAAFGLTLALLASVAAAGGEAAPAPATDGAVVLDSQTGFWRSFVTYKTPELVGEDGKAKPLPASHKDPKPAEVKHTAYPAKDWAGPDCDDRGWNRQRGEVGPGQGLRHTFWSTGSPASVALIVARGKFEVPDPAAAPKMKVAVEYLGGVAVYLNGKEIKRGHLPEGELGFEALAETYPADCYFRPDGKQLSPGNSKEFGFDSRDFADRFAARNRKLEAEVPPALLRKGVNVLAVAVYRSRFREAAVKTPFAVKNWRGAWGPWPHCHLTRVSLTAASAGGVVANVGRPKGVQLWTSPAWDEPRPDEYADPFEKLLPIRIAGARNAEFTGQVVVSSPEPLKGLKVTVSDLADAKGGVRLPAAAVAVRYPVWAGRRFEALAAKPPADGAVKMQPVWLTVRVPADTKAGLYEGRVTVEAQGLAATDVPLSIQLHGWRMPEAKDYGTCNHIWQSHDSLALNYGVPLWSDRHFELMGKSLELTRPMGNRFCALHLIAPAEDINNEQSFVRWIDKTGELPADGKPVAWDSKKTYEYDFSVFDRYLDLYAEKIGKPNMLVIDVWCWGCDQMRDEKKQVQLRTTGDMKFKVSLLDPKTGKVGLLVPPYHGTPEAASFWKPVLAEVRQRLEKRGWMDSVCLGTASDNSPRPETVAAFQEIWPEVPWFFSGHMKPATLSAGAGKTAQPVRCQEWVWGSGIPWDPDSGRGGYPTPWGTRTYSVTFCREGSGSRLRDDSDLATYFLNPERTLQSGLGGIGRVCADMWQVKGLKGRGWQGWLCNSPGQFNFHASIKAFLHQGAEGPEPTTRSQMFVEGVQVREAIIALQRAAKGGKAPDRITALLVQRARNTLAPAGTFEPQQEDDRLFALCAEVAGD